MKRRQYVSEDGLTIFRCITQPSTLMNGRENSEPIPIDLIYEILLRLPAKYIARFRCVSKLWASILRRPDFTELFLTRSSARPKLLFSCQKNGGLLFFSAFQVRHPNENSSLVASNYHMRFPFVNTSEICGHARGLVCLTHLQIVKGRKETVHEICNPSTGESLPLPKVKTRRVKVRSFFVYDPIGKQFKILSMSWPCYRNGWICAEHDQKLSWRMIECTTPHHPTWDGICINGCLHYQALVVRSEKFRFIRKAQGAVIWRESTLVNYRGKLGILTSDGNEEVTGHTRCIELWVLIDAEKHEWSKHMYVLPSLWRNLVAEAKLYFVGMTGTNEILLSPRYPSDHFYVFYYNIERNTVIRAEI